VAKAQLSDIAGGVYSLDAFFSMTLSILFTFTEAKIAAVYVRRAARDAHISSYYWRMESELPVNGTIDTLGFPGSRGNAGYFQGY
jgi:hypothetical protein